MDWLKRYYGSMYESLAPTVVFDGEKYAVVRIQRTDGPRDFSKVGYVLVKKKGNWQASNHFSLYEGATPTAADMVSMHAALKKADGK